MQLTEKREVYVTIYCTNNYGFSRHKILIAKILLFSLLEEKSWGVPFNDHLRYIFIYCCPVKINNSRFLSVII